MDLARRDKLKKLEQLLSVVKCYQSFLSIVHRVSQVKKKPRVWTRFIYSENERQLHGFFTELSSFIKNNNNDEFRKATRMGISEYTLLKTLLEKRIQKKDLIRQSISPECRLALTLVYLGHGLCRQKLAQSFRIGVSTIREIILETCEAIWSELHCIYLVQPNESEWENIAEQFYEKTGLSNVLGVIDSKHIDIKCPSNSGSLVLLASCDSNYSFTAVEIRTFSDEVLKSGGFMTQILEDNINIPKSKPLPNTTIAFPFYFIGDTAFPLKTNIMRPYPGRLLPPDKDNFNKKISRARAKIENTFGILTAKWKVLTSGLNLYPENAEKIIQACVVLHNFVKFHDSKNYCPQNYVDQFSETDVLIKGEWRQEVRPLKQSKLFTRFNATRKAFAIRDYLNKYLYTNS